MITIRSGKSEKNPEQNCKKHHLVLLMICCEFNEHVPKFTRVIAVDFSLSEFLGEELNKLIVG